MLRDNLDQLKMGAGTVFDARELEQAGSGAGDYVQLAGEIPQVVADAGPAAKPVASASERAYDQKAGGEEEDDNVKELKAKVGALVAKNFGGDYRAAFDHYDGDKDGGVKKDEIVSLLKDAGVGNGLTRGAWANGILKKLDKGQDGKIQWDEFQAVF
jgi:hypothetical protein